MAKLGRQIRAHSTQLAEITLRVYPHLVPSSHQRARLVVDTVFGQPGADDGLIVEAIGSSHLARSLI